MSAQAIAKRYAQAIFNEAVAKNADEMVEKDFLTLANILKAAPDLRRLFRSPIIDSVRKKKVAIEVFKPNVSELMMSFITLVLDKGRESLMLQIVREFEDLMDEKRNILRVEVTSAKTLDDGSKANIEASLKNMTKKDIRATYSENPTLLGGISVKIGDKVYDGSLRQQLELLRTKLANA